MTADEARAAVLERLRGAGPLRQGRGLRPRGGHLLPLRHRHRAAALAAVVHGHEAPGRARPSRRWRTAGCASCPSAGATSTWIGCGASGPGASAGSCGGGTASRPTTATTCEHIMVARDGPGGVREVRRPGARRTRTCSTPGSARPCGPSPPWAGPSRPPELAAFYPTSVLSTARDIIYLWVARMIMMGLEFMGDVPFRDVIIHPTVLAADGRRMSKSLGTGRRPAWSSSQSTGPTPPVSGSPT